jgi:hypothetical protein
MKYKVELLSGGTYQVLERSYSDGYDWKSSYPPKTTVKHIPTETWNPVFQGTLPECEAWINLHEKGYM